MESIKSSVSRQTILIIDDQPRNLQLAAHVLNPYYELILVNSGEKGLRIAAEKLPDLILLDIMMPEMSGYEVCTRLKQNDALREIPVIFVTAKTEEEDIIQAYEVGGVDYVMKPFRAKELLARVKTHLSIKEGREKIERLNVYLNELNENKDKLFSIISHDLRGNAGQVDTLADIIMKSPGYKEISVELKEPFVMLKQSSKNNRDMLDELLLWTRNQFNKLEFKPVPILVENIIDQVITQLQPLADTKQISLRQQLDDNLTLTADEDMLIVIFRNLISNAIKFSNAGDEITIRGSQQNDDIAIEVTDHGVGIAKEDLGKLFNKNAHLSTFGTAGEKGTGLGLELCADFVNKHSGKIEVESEPGKGSTFRVVLPVTNE